MPRSQLFVRTRNDGCTWYAIGVGAQYSISCTWARDADHVAELLKEKFFSDKATVRRAKNPFAWTAENKTLLANLNKTPETEIPEGTRKPETVTHVIEY
ncbi:hypothetical protein [Cerasicoccus maritimus]|uniref:hypothetical protein n=1 Tax=Cerasicoccus maritimus TaxID=490089 RepID=UPI0028526D04|nr:hypothetical protein [Cerasicoccus maritimus]